MPEWKFPPYVLRRLAQRKIPKEQALETLTNPERKVAGRQGRMVYQKRFCDKLLRVITEGDTVVTVYETSKLKKHEE